MTARRVSLMLALLGSAGAACTSDEPDGPPIEPAGTYTARVGWGPGDCGLSGTRSIPFALTKTAQGNFQFFGTSTAYTIDSSVFIGNCTSETCGFRGVFVQWYEGADAWSLSMDISFTTADQFTGTGTGIRYLSTYEDCHQQGSITGGR